MDWLELVVRWIHVITGVSWIGASFYFNWLNNSLRPPETDKEGVDGEVWAVHGGHFYCVNKYAVAPKKLPKTLHWFKYEAYFTWLSGFGLLAIVYYHGAKLYLIDPDVMALTPWQASAIGIAVLAVGWLVYDMLCKTALARKPVLFATIGFTALTVTTYALCQVFSARGAYLHMGALIGTMMAASNLCIIPNQKIMVDQMSAGENPIRHWGVRVRCAPFTITTSRSPFVHHGEPSLSDDLWSLSTMGSVGRFGPHWWVYDTGLIFEKSICAGFCRRVAMIALALVATPRASQTSDGAVVKVGDCGLLTGAKSFRGVVRRVMRGSYWPDVLERRGGHDGHAGTIQALSPLIQIQAVDSNICHKAT